MKDEVIVGVSEHSVSSTLSEKEKNGMSKIVNAMAPMGLIYDVDFRNLVEEH